MFLLDASVGGVGDPVSEASKLHETNKKGGEQNEITDKSAFEPIS